MTLRRAQYAAAIVVPRSTRPSTALAGGIENAVTGRIASGNRSTGSFTSRAGGPATSGSRCSVRAGHVRPRASRFVVGRQRIPQQQEPDETLASHRALRSATRHRRSLATCEGPPGAVHSSGSPGRRSAPASSPAQSHCSSSAFFVASRPAYAGPFTRVCTRALRSATRRCISSSHSTACWTPCTRSAMRANPAEGSAATSRRRSASSEARSPRSHRSGSAGGQSEAR